ncbi:hypothetical protein Syun_019305 [Stephania yunnanensis]|uniref:Aminotransferase-like plant mobile domain-containing protein n=1 Tax=Stephania yunnanensis TaxID=152371 RepID=A0AAP0NWJ7_9MAGN
MECIATCIVSSLVYGSNDNIGNDLGFKRDMDPDPIDDSILTMQALHRSTHVWNGPEPGILTITRNSAALHRLIPLDERIVGHLHEVGFYGTARIGFISIDCHLITALVEKWRPETHTFHFPVGEMTITLQDVQIILGLLVDGLSITGRVEQDYDVLCLAQLGFPFPENNKTGGRFKFTNFQDGFQTFQIMLMMWKCNAMRERTSYNFLEELYLQTSLTISFTSRICNFWRILRRVSR